ncbi:MAG: ABC transporter ATP-binding protein [Bacteroidota bacterium]
MIQLRGIERYYSSGFVKTYVLRHVDLDIAEGEFVTIMGPSGSGKSTLLYILGMLDGATDGTYEFMGERVDKMNERKRTDLHKRHIGFVFQNYQLIDELTVYENIETPLLYQGVKGGERKARVAAMLDKFGIVAKQKLFPHQLSGGQQQLVGIARAVVARPSLILADEPTGNLNSAQGEQIMETFAQLNAEGTTIIQVTHSERNAEYGNRTIHLLDGKVVPETQAQL